MFVRYHGSRARGADATISRAKVLRLNAQMSNEGLGTESAHYSLYYDAATRQIGILPFCEPSDGTLPICRNKDQATIGVAGLLNYFKIALNLPARCEVSRTPDGMVVVQLPPAP